MYPTYTRQGLTGIIGAAGARQLLNGLNVQINAQTFGATGDGQADDTTKIQAAINEAATITGRSKVVVIPAGDYLVQDPSTAAHEGMNDGVLFIPAGCRDLTIWGYGARLILGPRGAGTAVIRNFGGRNKILGIEIDLNGTVPDRAKDNVGIQINASHTNSVADVDGCDNVVRDCYIHGSRFLTEYITGEIIYDHTGNAAGERVVILTGGTWPETILPNGVISISGTWYDISSRVSDTVLQLGSGAGNNPGSDVGSTSYTLNAEPYKNQGRDGIQVLNGNRNTVENNIVEDMGWTSIRANGNGNVIRGNTLKDHRGNGIRLANGDYCLVEGNWISSVYCSGRSNLLADAGSGEDGDSAVDPTDPDALDNSDVRLNTLILRDNYSYCDSNGNFEGAGSAVKIGAVRNCVVDGGEYVAGVSTNNTAIRIEDCVRKITFQGVRCHGPFQQTNNAPTIALSATVSRASGDYTGKLQLTISGHGLVLGKSLWLVNCPVAAWDDQEFIVIEVVDANNVVVGKITGDDGTVTPEPYSASSVTGTVTHAGVHELVVRHCFIERQTHDENNFVRHVTSPWCTFEDNVFEQVGVRTDGTVKESGLLFDYPSDAYIKRLRIVRNEFRFYSSALCRAIRSTGDDTAASAATTFLTAGKFICYDNRLENKSTGTVELVQRYESGDSVASYDDRLIIFSTVGEDKDTYWGTGVPSETVVTFADGQRIRNSAPAAGGAPGWVCTTPGTSGTFRAEANLA